MKLARVVSAAAAVAVLVAVVGAVFADSFGGEFVFDDVPAVTLNGTWAVNGPPAHPDSGWQRGSRRLIHTPVPQSHKSYCPLMALTVKAP